MSILIFLTMKLKLNEVKSPVQGNPARGRTRAISFQVPNSYSYSSLSLQLCHLLAVWAWASHAYLLGPQFLQLQAKAMPWKFNVRSLPGQGLEDHRLRQERSWGLGLDRNLPRQVSPSHGLQGSHPVPVSMPRSEWGARWHRASNRHSIKVRWSLPRAASPTRARRSYPSITSRCR